MKRNTLTALIAVATLATFVVGCGGRPETNANASVAVNSNSDMSDASVNASAQNNPAAPASTIGANASPDATTKDGGRNAPAAKGPAPQIGSGGNDLYLFTRTRAALNADNGLKAAAINVSIKAGVVTLTGNVAGEAQKAKAEQLVRSVEGITSVENRLRTSAGGAKR